MQVPATVSFKNMPVSDAVEARIWEEAEKLERYADRITSCHVVVEAPDKHSRKGGLYAVRVDMTVPGGELAVDRAHHHKDHAHEDVYVAVRDAFHAARRRLEDYFRKMEGDVKAHEEPDHGRVARVLPDKGYGYIEDPEGRQIYFHRNSVLDGHFDDLDLGSEVRYVEEEGDKGPQATSVRPVGRHHHLT